MRACRSNNAAGKQITVFCAAFLVFLSLNAAVWRCCIATIKKMMLMKCNFGQVYEKGILIQLAIFCYICSAHLTLPFFLLFIFFAGVCVYVCVHCRYQATHYEWAYAPTPPGGTARWTRLHSGDAHSKRCSNCGLLWCTVHTGDPREGNTHLTTHTCTQ